MHTTPLNLARKWRSRTFDQVIDQQLALRMLKNSLYLNHYFPVYLFSGQRGCGKTTTARVFAAALNCSKLEAFQKDPKQTMVPCLSCASCDAMAQANHPDFIEIDAASHTGVDNIRSIIDAASLLPTLGRKKIYLIDEAHMLSKAAFNALLKILEEPPTSALFILATTDVNKVIDTVRSRCFQLFFKPVSPPVLIAHLKQLCTQENIAHQDKALELIVRESQGSVRDAINILEQVRFSASCVTAQAVREVLGFIDDQTLIELFDHILNKTPSQVLEFWSARNLSGYTPLLLWNSLIELIRTAVWISYGVVVSGLKDCEHHLKSIIAGHSASTLTKLLAQMYEHEHLFLKTGSQHTLLEMLVLTMCQTQPSSLKEARQALPGESNENKKEMNAAPEKKTLNTSQESKAPTIHAPEPWHHFLQGVQQLKDPLLSSIFKHAYHVSIDNDTHQVKALFGQDLAFFNEWLRDTKHLWQPLLEQHFGDKARFITVFEGKADTSVVLSSSPVLISPPQAAPVKSSYGSNGSVSVRKKVFEPRRVEKPAVIADISDKERWVQAHMLLKYFPGTIVYEQ